MTGITVPLVEFVDRARGAIENFAGVKYTSADLGAMKRCLAHAELDVLHGNDESLLAGLELGARGAVGSTYNFAPGVYLRLARAFREGDLAAAQREQGRAVALVQVLAARGYLAAAKALMAELGVEVGPPRLPHLALDTAARRAMRDELEAMGFFDWRLAPELAASGGADW